MQTIESHGVTPDALERDLARKLQEQVVEWKTMRSPALSRTAAGVPVKRRFTRRTCRVTLPPDRGASGRDRVDGLGGAANVLGRPQQGAGLRLCIGAPRG
ncbi:MULTISPECIES: hypothetical protein [Bradyrhizobium]|uniref:Uncharacterized protein n=1 Tax=Bradyrhizobium vignae TaxID=1549949 RepID=A0A2U3Q6E3_9BRAD|nr:hypothetical protein [Bradyrhizobium vignae]MBP0113852.1 hypothetical protein [Bradyrhizobium vignae]SPP97005.1 protein of unknown function [Bradyrhizobium vignae]